MKKREPSHEYSEDKDDSKHAMHAKKIKSLGHFTQGIVHDIRNSLQVVGGASAMIGRRTDDPIILHHLSSIEKTIDRTNGLINRILSFAKNSEDHLGVVDVSDSIDESIMLTRPMFPSGITVEWHRPLESVYILGDHGQLYQVVLNLFKNSIEAIGPDNSGTIFISLNNAYPWVEIRVKDSGPGIDTEVLDQVCDFAFTTKENGNGFGLANVYAIVEKHGGTIQVVSPEGQGAEFILLLPIISE